MERDILTNNGMDIHLVRYFDYQGKKYLIFTTDGENEFDEQGHIFVHISEINDLTATAVEGQTYETAKSIIKDIVAKNRNNLPLAITDLNYNDLNGLNIVSDKQLGLLPNYVDILKQNQPNFSETPINTDTNNFEANPFIPEQPIDFSVNQQANLGNGFEESPFNQFIPTEPVVNNMATEVTDYQKMYFEQVELVNKLNSEIEIYKNKLETLKNIINN